MTNSLILYRCRYSLVFHVYRLISPFLRYLCNMCTCEVDRAHVRSALEVLVQVLGTCTDEDRCWTLHLIIVEIEIFLVDFGSGCPIHGDPVSFVFLSRLSICFRQYCFSFTGYVCFGMNDNFSGGGGRQPSRGSWGLGQNVNYLLLI